MARGSIAVFLIAGLAWGQSFEVATLKRSPETGADRFNINLGSIANRRITFANASLSDCLKFAYGLLSDEQLAGPDWMKSKAVRFDIVGEAPEGARREDFPAMVQRLLAERLNVALHHEQRVLSYMALVKGPHGVRMKPPESEAAATTPSGRGKIDTPHMDMQRLAMLLSRFERVTVVNETGLTGLFQFRLEWTPDDPRPAGPDAGDAPSLYTAVQEQLGLRLEKRKGPIDVIVVDRADQVPEGN